MHRRYIPAYAMVGLILVTMIGLLVFFLTGHAVAGPAAAQERTDLPKIVVANGLQGRMVGRAIPEGGMFQGIPYTEPPIGSQRWRKPRTPVPFPDNVWNATYYRPGCPQLCNYKSKKFTCPDETDEDCLYLNIWVPNTILEQVDEEIDDVTKEKHYVISNNINHESLAVMVYIHGGNYVFGAGSAKIYDGRFIADQGNVVVVTFNYRLGALGFLVQGNGEDSADGNYGIWDQISALKWIQENIEFFGGNPEKVTLFGQSSGAESIGILMTSEHVTTKLFQQGIMSSNPLSLPLRDRNSAQEYGAKFAMKVGCDGGNMTCLREAKVEDILKAMKNLPKMSLFGGGQKMLAIQPWGPVIDGDFLKESPLVAFKEKKVKEIPLIIGATVNEGMYFVPIIFPSPVMSFIYQIALGVLMKDKSPQVLGKYPAENDNRYPISKIITDYVFICPERAAARASTSQTWFYLFNQTLPFKDMWDSSLCYDKVCHGADLPFVFNTVKLSSYKFSKDEQLLSNRMVQYWTNFAKYGNPNGKTEFINNDGGREKRNEGKYNAIFWPTFSAKDYSSYTALKFKSQGDDVVSDPYKNTCDFWDGLKSYGKFR